MEPTKELIDSIYIEKVLRARKLTEGERLATGIELFERALLWMRSGVQNEAPDADEARVSALLQKRLDRLRYVAEWKIYSPPQDEPR